MQTIQRIGVKKIALVMAVLITALFFCAPLDAMPSSAEAKSVSDYENAIDKLDDQIADLQNKINSNKGALASEQAKQEQYEDQIVNLEQQISLYKTKIDELNVKIEEQEKNIEEKTAEIKECQELFESRLRRMYITSMSSSTLSALLSAESFSDFLSRSEILKRISEEDQKVISELREVMEEYERLKAELDAQMEDLDASKAEVDAKLAEVEALYKKSEALEYSINAANKQYLANIEKYKNEIAANEREIQELLQQESGKPAYGSGVLKWPVPTRSYISSYFGWRTLRGKPNYHEGIDIPGYSGENIKAADAGKVIKVAKLDYGYGWHVLIDHGNGYATIYAHCSRIDVSVGQYVRQGQTIAGIGTTGNSTGNHVHFEVRVNGVKKNPLNYVKRPG